MDSRENSIRATNLFQLHYCINANLVIKCVMKRWTRERKKTKSLQFLVKTLTKLGSFIVAYTSPCEFL